jgi:hypothetical protein
VRYDTPAAIIREAAAEGESLALSSAGTIKATGDQAAVNRWLPLLREHKTAILTALAHPDALWWRVAILEPGARTVEVHTPSRWTLAEWATTPTATTTLGAP